MANTKIEWTNKTWNPVTGCTKVSEGCRNCYAEKMHARLRVMGKAKYQHPFNQVKCWSDSLGIPLRHKKPCMWFVNSMSDLFHPQVPFEFIERVFLTMSCMQDHTFQILTKRTHRLYEYFSWWATSIKKFGFDSIPSQSKNIFDYLAPLKNVWIGTSISNQNDADKNIYNLLRTPAAVRFLSIEPMLEEINLDMYDKELEINWLTGLDENYPEEGVNMKIDWVIVGCESGPHRRPCKLEWIESIVEQCKSANVPVFVKQINLNGKVIKDINQFPESLRIRQYPSV